MAYTIQPNRFSEVRLPVADAAYLAGLVDGEGSIYLVARKSPDRKSHHFDPNMEVCNTSLPLLEWIVATTGNGRIAKSSQNDHPNHKQGYIYQLGAKQIRHLLPQILPYMRLKRRQAELMLEFFSLQRQADRGPWGNADPKVVERILAVYEELRTLNRRGLKPVEKLEFTMGEPKERKHSCDEEGCDNRRYRGHRFCYEHWLKHREPQHRVCEECKAEFDAILPHRRFCSKQCQNRNSRIRREGIVERRFPCPQCGVEVVTTDSRKLTCSHECSQRLGKQNRKAQKPLEIKTVTMGRCARCGGEMEMTGHRKRYCSTECRRLAVNEKETARRHTETVLVHPPIPCEACGKLVDRSHYAGKRFCDDHCQAVFRARQKKLPADWKIERNCAVCGTPFSTKQGKQIYCSSPCTKKAYRLRQKEA